MKPGLRVNRGHKRCDVEIRRLRRCFVSRNAADFIGIPLLNHTEPTELAFHSVEVAVMIGVTGDEAVAANAVVRLHTLNTMDREGQACNPGFAVALVLEIELRGRRILENSLGTEIVRNAK